MHKALSIKVKGIFNQTFDGYFMWGNGSRFVCGDGKGAVRRGGFGEGKVLTKPPCTAMSRVVHPSTQRNGWIMILHSSDWAVPVWTGPLQLAWIQSDRADRGSPQSGNRPG
ncbi:hypothetical protein AA980_12875 [Neobacillus vireti]|nr:hypothetical protein AA980_12875 [Neobacillus vireti]